VLLIHIGTVLSGNSFSGNYLTDSSSVDTGEVVMPVRFIVVNPLP